MIERLGNEIKNSSNLKLLPPVSDEHSLLQLLLHEPPQMMIIDLADKNMGSVGAFDILRRMPLSERPVIIAVCGEVIPEVFEYIHDQLVQMFVAPYDADVVAHWADAFASYSQAWNGLARLTHATVDRLSSNCLRELGISPHLMGYHTLREAVKTIVCMRSSTRIQVVKHIYQTVADVFNSNPSAVEHSMRHAIDTAWMRADINTLQSYFGYTFKETRDTPSNSQFIFMVAEHIRTAFETEFIPDKHGEVS